VVSAGNGGHSPAPSGGAPQEPAPSGGSAGAPEGSDGDLGCDDAVLCDDFEDDTSGMAPGTPWTVDVNGGAVQISDERAFSGEKSVLVSNTEGAFKRAYFSVASRFARTRTTAEVSCSARALRSAATANVKQAVRLQ
jgi:hypothetical protein